MVQPGAGPSSIQGMRPHGVMPIPMFGQGMMYRGNSQADGYWGTNQCGNEGSRQGSSENTTVGTVGGRETLNDDKGSNNARGMGNGSPESEMEDVTGMGSGSP